MSRGTKEERYRQSSRGGFQPPAPVDAQHSGKRSALDEGFQFWQGLDHLVPHFVDNDEKACLA